MCKIKNFILELHPITKFLFIIFIIISVFVVSEYIYSYSIFFVCIIIAYLARELKQFSNLAIKGLLIICLVMFIFQCIFYPGDTILWRWSFLSISQEGIYRALSLTSTIIAVGSPIILYFRITPVKEFIYSLEDLGLPSKVTYLVLSTFSIVPEMMKASAVIMEAQKTRGVETEGNLKVRAKAFIPIIIPLVLTSMANTESRAIALDARAFTVQRKKTRLYNLEKTGMDLVVRILLLISLIILIVWRVSYELY